MRVVHATLARGACRPPLHPPCSWRISRIEPSCASGTYRRSITRRRPATAPPLKGNLQAPPRPPWPTCRRWITTGAFAPLDPRPEQCALNRKVSQAPRTAARLYRTSAGAEIDLLLGFPGKYGLWAIEIKRGVSATPSKGFHNAREDLNPARSFIVHSGHDRFPVTKGVEVTDLANLAGRLADLQ